MRAIFGGALATVIAIGGAVPVLAQETPEVRQKGKFVMQWKDDKVQVVVGLRFANAHFPSKWLMIQTAITATGNKPIRIDREDVSLTGPGGMHVNLATQKAVQEGIPDIRRDYQEAAITQDPIEGYIVGPERYQRIGFFAPPTSRITYDQVTLDHSTVNVGYLFFQAPGDKFPPGRYALEIYNKDVDLKLPFSLPTTGSAPDKEKPREKGDKSVPW